MGRPHGARSICDRTGVERYRARHGRSGWRLPPEAFSQVAALVSNDAPIDWSILAVRSNTPEAFDHEAGIRNGNAVIQTWIDATLALVTQERRPSGLHATEFDLAGLLAWRIAVLRRRPLLGRPLTERLLAEGARTLVGLPLEPSPPTASRGARIRRNAAARASRLASLLWRAGTPAG